jgi:hypothetical protein
VHSRPQYALPIVSLFNVSRFCHSCFLGFNFVCFSSSDRRSNILANTDARKALGERMATVMYMYSEWS